MPNFCAICTGGGPLHLEWIDGKRLAICADCSLVHPRSGRYGLDGGRPAVGPSINVIGFHNHGNRRTPGANNK